MRASQLAVQLPADSDTSPGLSNLDSNPRAGPAQRHVLLDFYSALYDRLGPQHWWPARTPFEVILGAILTQNTTWKNVERAIVNLRKHKLLSVQGIERVPARRLQTLIRSSGYFRQKTRKLKSFVRFLRREFGGSLRRMFAMPTAELREKLLAINGIGPETADSILLYAGRHPVFVVDAYTRRILLRHGLTAERNGYEALRSLFESSLPRDIGLYNEYHALLVKVGKDWCRPKHPRCEQCPLAPFLPAAPESKLRLLRSPEL